MDAREMKRIEEELRIYLSQYDDCFDRCDTRAHLTSYVSGQLADLDAKSVEPIALRAGVPVRTLQEFLAQHRWHEDLVRRRVAALVCQQPGGRNSVGIIDETSDVKKGDKTPGVQRQWCGKVGKKENCIVNVHLAYARDDFHALLDGELFLPESWSADRPRCRAAKIPDSLVYRPKWQIALELYDRAIAEGVQFEWITADEGYGSKPGFLEGLESRKQRFVVEVPRNFSVWIEPPQTTARDFRRRRAGRGRSTPRVQAGQPKPRSVENVFWFSEAMKNQSWKRYQIKESKKGPIVWEAKRILVTLKGSDDLPGMRLWLIVARNCLDPTELKFFVSNGDESETLSTQLLVGFSRWRVERCFEDQKQEIGLDCFEGRTYVGLKRHLILSSVSYLFLSLLKHNLGGKKSRIDRTTITRRDRRHRPSMVGTRTRGQSPLRSSRRKNSVLSKA